MPELQRTPGVAGIYSFGGLEKRYSVIFRPAQLLRYGLSLADVIDALEKNNASGGGGILSRGSMALVIRGTDVIEDGRMNITFPTPPFLWRVGRAFYCDAFCSSNYRQ
jgi:cobalt-zinc-cadmium resistance protein CzcA